jgi:hypothetical protein
MIEDRGEIRSHTARWATRVDLVGAALAAIYLLCGSGFSRDPSPRAPRP